MQTYHSTFITPPPPLFFKNCSFVFFVFFPSFLYYNFYPSFFSRFFSFFFFSSRGVFYAFVFLRFSYFAVGRRGGGVQGEATEIALFFFFQPQLYAVLYSPRHPSPRSRVCAQEWHRKDIHSHIHSHLPMHTPKTKSKTLNSPEMKPSFSCPLPVQSGGGRRPGSLADAPHDCSTSEAFSPRTVLTENICRCVQHKVQHFPTTVPFLTTTIISLSCLASAAPQADSW